MAGARAAASLSLTIGVAFVTVLVMGGILAGPTIIDCSHQPSSFGACLRDHLDHARFGPAPEQPSQVIELPSQTPLTTLPPPAIPVTQPEIDHGEGWLDARANEYAPPRIPDAVPPPLPALPELVTPSLPPPAASSEVAEIEVLPPPPHPRPAPSPTIKPKADIKQPVTKPVHTARVTPQPVPKPRPVTKPRPVRTFTNDPRFPHVTVLPAPAKGANSSFVTLETH